MTLIMTIEVELNEEYKKYVNSIDNVDKALKQLIEEELFLDLGVITKVENIDYLMHEIKKPL